MKKTHFKIDSQIERAGFVKISNFSDCQYWIIPGTGRILCLTDKQTISNRITQLGGLSVPLTCSIIDIIHGLTADEHGLIENLI